LPKIFLQISWVIIVWVRTLVRTFAYSNAVPPSAIWKLYAWHIPGWLHCMSKKKLGKNLPPFVVESSVMLLSLKCCYEM
jgi:hypothetical protein